MAPQAELSLLEQAVEAAGGPEKFLETWKLIPAEDRRRFGYDWRHIARPKQLPSGARTKDGRNLGEAWATWMVRAGRGWGKTRVGAEFIRGRVEAGLAGRIALVARTAADARDVMVEGESGLLAISPPWFRPKYEPSKRRVTWPNGAVATLFSAEEPDLLRGPQHDLAWCDELAAWARLQDTWDNLQFGLRLGSRPQVVVTTTPRGLKFLRTLEADPTTVISHGSTHENAKNLPPVFIKKLDDKYAGTRLGRQEVGAEILDDNPNALWTHALIERARLTVDEFMRIHRANIIRTVVAIDPATSTGPESAETGIVVTAAGYCWCKGTKEIHGYVLEDVSGMLDARKWALEAGMAYQRWRADRVIAEKNQGGNLVEANLVANSETKNLPIKLIHAKDGKRLRAEPVAALYEQAKVHHVGGFPQLEDQMADWDPRDISAESPDRLDAKVHGVTEVMLEDGQPPEYRKRDKPVFQTRR